MKKNIKFKCQGSSNCCVSRGMYGYVYLSSKDTDVLSKFFLLSTKNFIKKHCSYTDGFLHLIEKKGRKNCQFLKNKRCTVYSARPTQCRTWPFWSENMNSKKWNSEIMSFCPGIGKGQIISQKIIKKRIKKDLINEKKIYEENIKFNYLLK